MKDKELMGIYKSLVPFLSEVCGVGCEIVVHDVTDPDRSIVAIANSSTGRKIGDSMTDLARNIATGGDYKINDFISGYTAVSKKKKYLSYTYYIKNNGKLIGLLCVNKDSAVVKDVADGIAKLLDTFNLIPLKEEETKENLEPSVSLMLRDLVEKGISQMDIPPSRMSMQEKVDVVHKLNDQGVLMMKGAVAEIALQLEISEPTVYRYLNRKRSV